MRTPCDLFDPAKLKLAKLYLDEFGNHVEAMEQLESLTPKAQSEPGALALKARALEMGVAWWQHALDRARLVNDAAPHGEDRGPQAGADQTPLGDRHPGPRLRWVSQPPADGNPLGSLPEGTGQRQEQHQCLFEAHPQLRLGHGLAPQAHHPAP